MANHILGSNNSITHFGFNLRNTPSYHVKHLTHALEQDTVVESLDWGDSRTLGMFINKCEIFTNHLLRYGDHVFLHREKRPSPPLELTRF